MTRSIYKVLLGAAALSLVLGAGAARAEEAGKQGADRPPQAETLPPEDQGTAAEPLEPVLVQGFVKSIDKQQLTLTAPGAPEDLPLRLHPETRFIQGENDVDRSNIQEGQLVRAALVPTGEEFVAVVVEQVEEEPAAPAPGEAPQQGAPAPESDSGVSSPEEPSTPDAAKPQAPAEPEEPEQLKTPEPGNDR